MDPQARPQDEDDGRVICDMDVEGMRWHDKKVRRKTTEPHKVTQGTQLTRSEMWRYNWYSILAGMLIVSVFSITWVLFILFCTQVWLR
jgi:hypothetical protein